MLAESLAVVSTVAGLLGVSAQDLLARLREKRRAFGESEALRFLETTDRVLRAGFHVAVLEDLYPQEALRKEGLSHLVVGYGSDVWHTAEVVPDRLAYLLCGRLAARNVSCRLIGCLENQVDSEDAVAVLAEVEMQKLRIWDSSIYLLRACEPVEDGLQLDFSIGRFFPYRFTLGSLWDELMFALMKTGVRLAPFQGRSDLLPRRCRYLPDAKAMADVMKRTCAGGVNMTVAFAREGRDFVIPVQRRSRVISDGQSTLGVVHGYHQPLVDPVAEIHLEYTALREVYEELLGGDDAIGGVRHIDPEWFLSRHPAMKWLDANRESWQLVVTSFAFGLSAGDYNVGLLLVVADPEFYHRFRADLVVSWEMADELTPLVSSKDEPRVKELLRRPDWNGPARTSFIGALRWLEAHHADRVTLDRPALRLA